MDQFTDSILGALPDQIFCAADVIVTGGQILAHRASVLDQALVEFRYELFDGVSAGKRRGLCQHCKLKKWANPGLFYRLVSVFSSKHHYNFYKKICVKMSIQYMVPGFEPTTFGDESPPITTRPGLPPYKLYHCKLICFSWLLVVWIAWTKYWSLGYLSGWG